MSENPSPVEIGFLVFPKVQQLDLTGPYEVFASWPRARVQMVAKTLEPVSLSQDWFSRPMRRSNLVRDSTCYAFLAARGSTRS